MDPITTGFILINWITGLIVQYLVVIVMNDEVRDSHFVMARALGKICLAESFQC